MDVPASPGELPELRELLGSFHVRFRHPAGAKALERYLRGLLTERPTQNCDTIAQAVPGTREQRRQAFRTNMPWEAAALNRQRVQKLRTAATWGDGVLVRDDTGFAQQGQASVGVARQDSGTLGKVGHGQSAVTCCDTDPQAMWPVAVRWSLPPAWAEARERRGHARVPAEVTLQTTPAIALAWLDLARAWGVPHRWVGADADDGDTPHFLAGLEARHERDGVGVRVDCRVSLQWQATRPVPRADRLLQALPRGQWRTLRWRQGTQGWRRKKCVARRGWRLTRAGRRHVGWRVGARAPRGQPEERQSYGSHLLPSATREELAGYAPRRYAVAPFHEEANGEGGWDQDQGRLWPGCPRQAITVRRAYSVLVWLELRQRCRPRGRGRPRDPCSPSAGPAAPPPASGPA
jgi:DDE superfamily endonuclease